MDILLKNVPTDVYNVVSDTQNELKKKKKRTVSQSEVIIHLLRKSQPYNCDSCGKPITGEKHQMHDEQFNPQNAFECDSCFKKSISD